MLVSFVDARGSLFLGEVAFLSRSNFCDLTELVSKVFLQGVLHDTLPPLRSY